MRIIDKNTDFYDYLQNIYRDPSLVFDRTDSFLLTKEIMCEHLYAGRLHSRRMTDRIPQSFLLLQICHEFWLFMVDITEQTDYGKPKDYAVELVTWWHNHNKPRRLIALDVVDFGYKVSGRLYRKWSDKRYDRDLVMERASILTNAVDTDDFRVVRSINKHTVYRGDNTTYERHIPLLKACGLAGLLDPMAVFLALEEYFSLEKSDSEQTESIGLTDKEKIGNHGFDVKTSFRGK